MELKEAIRLVWLMSREVKWGRGLSQKEKEAINEVAKFLESKAKDPYDLSS